MCSDDLSALDLSRTLLRDAQDLLVNNWNPFDALDLSMAMLEAQKAGLGEFNPLGYFMDGLEALRYTSNMRPWLYHGAARIGWTATQLHRALGLRLKNSQGIDEQILSWIDNYPSQEDAELLFGVAGLGVYGLDHINHALGQRIVSGALHVIDERLERGADGSYVRLRAGRWDKPGASRRRGWKAVGVAHGNAGIAAFLAAVVRSSLGLADKAQPMLLDVTRWLVSVASHNSVYVFDSSPELTGKEDQKPPGRRGRSSWCHGDPGVSLALLSVAGSLDDPELKAQSLACSQMAAGAVISRQDSLAGIQDCCVCHGAAFLYYFGRRMCRTGHHEAASFSEKWYSYIQERRAHDSLTYQRPDGMTRDASFLNGDSGVVCVLTRYIHDQAAGWERLLLMT
jgi:hypothetical protein